MVYVDVDNYQGAILGHGTSDFPWTYQNWFHWKPNLTSSIERLDGYKDTLQKHNIAIDPELDPCCRECIHSWRCTNNGRIAQDSEPAYCCFPGQ